MADISKCTGDGCARKEKCYRFTAESNEFRQAWFMHVPLKEDGDCEYFAVDYYAKDAKEKNDSVRS